MNCGIVETVLDGGAIGVPVAPLSPPLPPEPPEPPVCGGVVPEVVTVTF